MNIRRTGGWGTVTNATRSRTPSCPVLLDICSNYLLLYAGTCLWLSRYAGTYGTTCVCYFGVMCLESSSEHKTMCVGGPFFLNFRRQASRLDDDHHRRRKNAQNIESGSAARASLAMVNNRFVASRRCMMVAALNLCRFATFCKYPPCRMFCCTRVLGKVVDSRFVLVNAV